MKCIFTIDCVVMLPKKILLPITALWLVGCSETSKAVKSPVQDTIVEVNEPRKIDSNKVYEYVLDETNSGVEWNVRKMNSHTRVNGRINIVDGVIRVKSGEIVDVDFHMDMTSFRFVGLEDYEMSDSLITNYIKSYSLVKDYLGGNLIVKNLKESSAKKEGNFVKYEGRATGVQNFDCDFLLLESQVDEESGTVRAKFFREIFVTDSVAVLPTQKGDMKLDDQYWVDVNLVGNYLD